MQRPTGVVVIAVLYWIGAFFILCVGGLLLVGSTAFGFFGTNQMGNVFAGLGIIGGVVCVAIGAVAALVGYGLFQLKEWARIVVIVFAAIGLLFGMASFFLPGMFLFGKLIRLAVNALIIWYLMQPPVKAAFGVA